MFPLVVYVRTVRVQYEYEYKYRYEYEYYSAHKTEHDECQIFAQTHAAYTRKCTDKIYWKFLIFPYFQSKMHFVCKIQWSHSPCSNEGSTQWKCRHGNSDKEQLLLYMCARSPLQSMNRLAMKHTMLMDSRTVSMP